MRHFKTFLTGFICLLYVTLFAQTSMYHQSLWWDGFVVTASGINTMTNGNAGLTLTNSTGGQATLVLAGPVNQPVIQSSGAGMQLGVPPNLLIIDSLGDISAVANIGAPNGTVSGLNLSGNGSAITAINAGNISSGILPVSRGGLGNGTGNGSGLTNVSLADGGLNGNWGSPTGMNPANNTQPIMYVHGHSAGYANGGDSQIAVVNFSTNAFDSGSGIGPAVMGGDDGTGKASIFSLVGGPMLVSEQTNRAESLAPGTGYIVHNAFAASKAQVGFGLSSPGYGSTGETWNHFGLFFDTANGFMRFPLGGSASGGMVQPASVTYQLTVSGVTVNPGNGVSGTFSVYSNNANWFTSYSNNISGGAGPWMVVGSFGAPAASGIMTKIQGPGDATITFSAYSVLRSYAGDAMSVNPNGNVSISGTNTATNGFVTKSSFQTLQINTAANGVNPFSTSSNITFQGANASGFLVQDTGGVESVSMGTRGHYAGSANSGSGGDLWYSFPTADDGGDELADFNNRGNNTRTVHGRFGTYPTNYAGNKTLGILDSTVIVKANGVAVITLPDATSHAKGAQYQVLNDGTTNVTLATTGGQTIGNNSTLTSITIGPGQFMNVQGNTLNWNQIGGSILPGGVSTLLSNTLAPTSITAPLTTVNWTNPINADIEVYIDNSGVTGTSIKKNGTQIFSSLVGDVTIGLQPNEFISLTYTIGTPSIKWSPR